MRGAVEHLTEHFEYLDDLRDSGRINMFGAASYLARDHLLDMPEARTALAQWMATFSDAPAAERAAAALNSEPSA